VKSFCTIRRTGTAVLFAVAALSSRAQDAALPPAPSAVLAQYDAGKPAGSGKIFKAPSTFTGPGKVTVERAANDPLPLSIDDAVAYGLTRNLRLVTDRTNQQIVRGDLYQVTNALVPALRLDASTNTQEINLAAMGFKPGAVNIPGFTGTFPTIVKVNVTQALLHLDQTLFNVPAYELLRGAKDEEKVVNLNTLSGRGDLVLAVGQAYLKVLADQSNLANTQSLEVAAKTLFDQATAKRDAGVGTSLDALRGQVEYQNR